MKLVIGLLATLAALASTSTPSVARCLPPEVSAAKFTTPASKSSELSSGVPASTALVHIRRVGSAPERKLAPGGYETYRGSHNFQAYLERPAGWRLNYEFAIKYQTCTVSQHASMQVTLYLGRIMPTDDGRGRAVLKRPYSTSWVGHTRSVSAAFHVRVTSQTYYLVRVATSRACTYRFASEPAD
jgi:hypothetical protein